MAKRVRKSKSQATPTPTLSFEGSGVLNVKSLTFGRIAMSGVLDIPAVGKCFIESTTVAPNDQLGEIKCNVIAADGKRSVLGSLELPRNREIRREAKLVMADGKVFRCAATYQSFERNGESVRRFKLGLPGFERPQV